MRPTKTTREIGIEELDRLKHPEARETAAFDPIELAELVDLSTPDRRASTEGADDLAIPVEPLPPVLPLATPLPTPIDAVMAAAWCAPTKESAVIVSAPPEDDPPPALRGMRAITHPDRISTPAPRMPRGSTHLAEQVAWMHRSKTPWLLVVLAATLVGAGGYFLL